MKIRTLLNVGQLGPDEERWPEDETYDLSYSPYLGLVLEEHRTWTASLDDPDSPEGEKDLLRRLGKASSLGSPVIVDGQLWGEFYATRPVGEDPFDDRDVAYIEALVAILSGSVSRALREESLERLVYLDPLTGLWNRRALDERAAEAFESHRARVGRSPSSRSTSTGSSRSTTPWATMPATSSSSRSRARSSPSSATSPAASSPASVATSSPPWSSGTTRLP